jgi:polysaccharide export outer membrane protein
VAALSSLCTAGIGCQTSSLRNDAVVARSAPAPQRSLFTIQQKPPTATGTTNTTATPEQPPARPVVSAPVNSNVIASTGQTVQRVRAEEVVENTNSEASNTIARTPGKLSPYAETAVDLKPTKAASTTNTAEGDETPPSTPVTSDRIFPEAAPIATVAPPAAACARPPVPTEDSKQAHPTYRVEPPDILLIQGSAAVTLPTQPLDGQHLVRPDGTIDLGIYGTIFVAGLTLEEIKDAVAAQLQRRLRGPLKPEKQKPEQPGEPKDRPPSLTKEEIEAKQKLSLEDIKLELRVDVLAYNSKVYYIITDGGGYGAQVYRIVSTGNETVLDALAHVQGLPAVASKKKVWVARATADCANPQILPVNWHAVVQCGVTTTNYQIFPGDRIYVGSDPWIAGDSWLAKRLAPVERLFGVTLLGSSAINSIRTDPNRVGGTGTTTR